MTTKEYIQYLNNFLQELDEERFYDAHETLEKIWFPRRFEDSDEIKLIKGFINAAVSFELIKKGRIEPAKKVWKNYLKYKPLINQINSKYIKKYNSIIMLIDKIKNKSDNNHFVV